MPRSSSDFTSPYTPEPAHRKFIRTSDALAVGWPLSAAKTVLVLRARWVLEMSRRDYRGVAASVTPDARSIAWCHITALDSSRIQVETPPHTKPACEYFRPLMYDVSRMGLSFFRTRMNDSTYLFGMSQLILLPCMMHAPPEKLKEKTLMHISRAPTFKWLRTPGSSRAA